MKDLLPKYFSSEWSFAQFKVAADCRCICAFGGEKNTVIGKKQSDLFCSVELVLPVVFPNSYLVL